VIRARYLAALLLGCGIAALAAACAPQTERLQTQKMQVQRFEPGSYPTLLSDWQLLTRESTEAGDNLKRASDTLIYRINTPLFADYTLKLRTISLPEGTQASYNENAVLGFPVGTVISKTFYYDTRDVPLDESASARPALFTGESTTSLRRTQQRRVRELPRARTRQGVTPDWSQSAPPTPS